MLRKILNWLLNSGGLLFATLMLNIFTATIATLIYVTIAMIVVWWDKHI